MSGRKFISSTTSHGVQPPRSTQDRLTRVAKTEARIITPPVSGLVSSAENLMAAVDAIYRHVLSVCSDEAKHHRGFSGEAIATAVARKILGEL